MSCLNFEYGERWLQEEIKRDSARLTQLKIERRMRLNKAPKEKLKNQPRKVKFEDKWDLVVTNRRHGGEVGEKLSQSPNTSFGEPSQLKEEEKRAISKPPLENKPETDEIEEIEVTAEEGELWVEGLIPSLQEKEDEEVLVQVEEPQVQALPAVGVDMGENRIKGGQFILIEGGVNEQETSTNVADLDNISTEEEDDIRAELKIDNVEHIDFIGVDRFDVHPNFMLLDFFNKLRRIALQYGLNFEEFCFT
ncbi:hypothetical protein LguiA_025962 [Lonicera macranthoides]